MKSAVKRILSLVLVIAIIAGFCGISASAYYSCKHTEIKSRNDANLNTIFTLIDSQAFSSDSARNSAKERVSHLLYDSKFNPFDRNTFPYLNKNGYVDYVNDGVYNYEVKGAGCFAYCKWASKVVYNGGHGDRLYPTNSSGAAVKTVSGLTADIIKNFMMSQCQAGEHIRIDNTHSITFLGCNDGGYYYLEYYKDSAPYIRLCYSTYSQFLSALQTAGTCIWVYNANKYVNQASNVPSVPNVTLSAPTDPSYTSKQFVSNTNACLVTQISKPAGSNVTQCGLILMNADGSLLKRYTEDITGVVGKNTTVFHSWYDINTEVGVTLSPGTTYKYRFFTVVDGTTFEGSTYSFTTGGPARFTATLYSGLDYSDSASITLTKGEAYGYLPSPSLPEGYNFIGWFTAKEGGELVLETSIFNGSSDISLYARYTKKPVEVKITEALDEGYASKQYVGETSACLVAAVSKTAGSEASEVGMYLMDSNGKLIKRGVMDARNQISKESTLFHVWCDTKENLGLELQPATTYKYRFFAVVDSQSFEGPEYSFTTKTLPVFTVTFYSGLDYSTVSEIQISKGQAFGALPSPFIPENYNFLGWFTEKEGGEQVFENTVLSVSGNLSLYARYEEIEKPVSTVFSISYSPNGGTGRMMTRSFNYGDAVKVDNNAFTNKGYDFDCWVLYREEDGKYYTDNGWQSYEDMLTSGYLLATFEENSTWELDGLWTAGCENARVFSFVAIWKEAGSEPEVEPVTNPFTDVKPTDYFYDPVLWAVDEGVTSGLTPTTFGPKSTCTRAQVVTFLWRAMGKPAPSSYANPFTDVKPGDYFYEAVLWAVEQGITNGLSATSFGASQPCTRAQVATFLWRTMGKPAPSDGYCPFGDVAANAYYYQAVLWAVENGVTSGLSPSSFGPNAECSRAQIVTFLYRAIEE